MTSRQNSNDLLSIDKIRENILPLFSLDNSSIDMVKFKDTEKQRAVFKIDTNDKSYCLKKVYYNEGDLLFVYSAMEWVHRNYINVPKLLPSRDGNRYIKYNNMLFILTPWITADKCDFDNINHLKLSSKTLAQLHKTSKSFIPIEGSNNKLGLNDYNISLNKHFNTLLINANLASKHKDKFSKIFLDSFEYNLQLAKIALEISSTIDNKTLSTSLCHGDYVNKNILIEDNKKIWIIDFDKCCYDYSAHDIAYFLRRLLKRPTTNWDIPIAVDFLNQYNNHNNLSPSDFKYILAYLAFPQKYWKVSRDYYKNIKKCNINSFITVLNKSIERSTNQLDFIYTMISIYENRYGIKF